MIEAGGVHSGRKRSSWRGQENQRHSDHTRLEIDMNREVTLLQLLL